MKRLAVSAFIAAFVFTFVPVQAEDGGATQSKFFDSNGVKIHYIEKGEGEPVILIHGFSVSIPIQWQMPGIFDALAEDYHVIALDNRGHGKSDKPHGAEHYGEEMVKDVIRLMDHLEFDKAHVVGYSMGGFMTTYLLANYPERLLSATPSGAGWQPPKEDMPVPIEALAESLENGKGFGPLIEGLTPEGRPKPTEEEMKGINAMLTASNDVTALAGVIRGMMGMAVTEKELRKNKVPTLALIGEVDPLKQGVDRMAEVMSNLEVVVLDGADHMTAPSHPKFIQALKEHLAEHSRETVATK